MKNLTHFSLFSGIGGIELSAERAGFETVGQCEFADYPTKILEKHWADVPRWRDIRDVTAESFRERTGLSTIDLISGGFPCQPFSVAGKQEGKEDDRYLWPEMLRVIRELKPAWVLGENVPGILRIAGRTVCEDLEREGYDIAVFSFEAAAIGAPHRRERVFFVANANFKRELQQERCIKEFGGRACNVRESIANTNSTRLQVAGHEPRINKVSAENRIKFSNGRSTQSELGGMDDGISPGMDGVITFPPEPDIPRVATGIKNRVDRLKCLGNAVVPQQVYPILQAIADIEKL